MPTSNEISPARRGGAVLAALFLLAYAGGTHTAERLATVSHIVVVSAGGLAYARVGTWPASGSLRTIVGAVVVGVLVAAVQLVRVAPASDYEIGVAVGESIATSLLFGGLAALIRLGVVRESKDVSAADSF